MRKRYLFVLMLLMGGATAEAQVAAPTLEECLEAAKANYPLVRNYDLLRQTADLNVENIGKGWLPQISATAQATLQNRTVALPSAMSTMLSQQGAHVKGLSKDQYKVGIDVNQTVYDGGRIHSGQELARLEGAVDAAQTDVSIYAVQERVCELYFGILLVDDRLRLNADLQQTLLSSEQKLAAMVKGGTAAESDLNTVKAERLNAHQQATELRSQRAALLRLLGYFTALKADSVVRPAEVATAEINSRPELRLTDAQIRLTEAQKGRLDAALRPQLSVFASGYYGYPGYDMYHDMLRHEWSLNGMVGARITWNIGALYTRKNDLAKLRLQREQAENAREVFLFNNGAEQIEHRETISRYRQLMAEDDEIIGLRAAVRKAAESKLSHGIIDSNDLVREINNENQARLMLSLHQVEMLKAMHQLRLANGYDKQ